MKKIRIFAAVSILGLCAMAAPAMAEDVTLNALFMKQAGYSEEDVTAMTQAFTESTGSFAASSGLSTDVWYARSARKSASTPSSCSFVQPAFTCAIAAFSAAAFSAPSVADGNIVISA